MQYAAQLEGLRALIEESKAAAERAKHDLADSLARISEAERLVSEIEALREAEADKGSTEH